MKETRIVQREDGTATFYTKNVCEDGTTLYYAQEWFDGHVSDVYDVTESDWNNAKSSELPIDYDWLTQNVVTFISQGGAGHYDVNDMEPLELAEFMVDYWRENENELPAWFDVRSRQWCIEQLAETFASQRT